MKKYVVILGILILTGFAYAERTVWYIHPDSALNSIQAGLDSCTNNDIVLVGPGTYVENIIWPNIQGVHLISELGPEVTIIDGDNAGRVITCSTYIDTTTIIRGFTIENGFHNGYGGGILCYACSPTIAGNIIKNNEASGLGGGIACYGSSSVIDGNLICNNICNGVPTWPPAYGGGGIGVRGGHVVIIRNTVVNNYVEHCGGGVLVSHFNAAAILHDNDICENTAEYGGSGIYCEECTTSISTCHIRENISNYDYGAIGIWAVSFVRIDTCTIEANDGYGVWIDIWSQAQITIANCEISGNTGYGIYHSGYSPIIVNAEYNWWGDSTGPYHPDSNPGGLGDTVSDYVDFIPWLYWPGVEEYRPAEAQSDDRVISMVTIHRGSRISFNLKESCEMTLEIFDITGRRCWSADSREYAAGAHMIDVTGMANGIYFVICNSDKGIETRKVLLIR